MKKSYIERAMRMAEILSSYMEKYNEVESIYRKCQMATQEYNNRHKHSSMGFESGSTRLAFIVSDYVLKVDYAEIEAYGNSESELKAWDFIRESRMEKYFAEITKYVSKSGITFYIMPRISHVGDYGGDWLLDYLYVNDVSACSFIQDNFNDFHDYNFGIKCGHPRNYRLCLELSVRRNSDGKVSDFL